MDNHLEHHGIIGMKWGVRRYQNYDGTYTQKGLKRYKRSSDKYEQSKNDLKKAKESNNKAAIKSAKQNLRQSKKELSNAYDQLALDKKADQGKRLYRQGKTITGNLRTNMIAQAGIVAGSYVANSILTDICHSPYASLAANTIAIGGTVVNGLLGIKTAHENTMLRAYYAHS